LNGKEGSGKRTERNMVWGLRRHLEMDKKRSQQELKNVRNIKTYNSEKSS